MWRCQVPGWHGWVRVNYKYNRERNKEVVRNRIKRCLEEKILYMQVLRREREGERACEYLILVRVTGTERNCPKSIWVFKRNTSCCAQQCEATAGATVNCFYMAVKKKNNEIKCTVARQYC